MAGGEDAIRIVDKDELEDGGGSIVHMQGVEKESLFSFLSGRKGDDSVKKTDQHQHADASAAAPQEKGPTQSQHGRHLPHQSHHSKPVVHEGESVKTTYDVEEDESPSMLEKVKRKVHWNGR